VSPRLVLASGSPRRAQILGDLGVDFRVVVSAVDETLLDREKPAEVVERLARAKALAVASSETLPVLGADTIVAIDGIILGKPASVVEAEEMLRRLSGREHEVLTGVCLVRGSEVRSGVDCTRVRFDPISDEEIRTYVATGEPMDKAGAYHVDGNGAAFIAEVIGSRTNVAGLPVELVRTLAHDLGVDLGGRV
jgi:septum formation protein